MREYRLFKVLAEGIVVIDMTPSSDPRAIWTKCKVRKHKKCALSGKDLYGLEAYRPIGNQDYRMERIDATIIDKEVEKQMAQKKSNIAKMAKRSRKTSKKRTQGQKPIAPKPIMPPQAMGTPK
jgi:hypothetical protein